MAHQSEAPATNYEITIGGKALTQSGAGSIVSLVFEDHLDMIDMVSVRLGGSLSDAGWSWEIGQEVVLTLGDSDTEVFSGEIVALEPQISTASGSSLLIRAMDKMHRLGRGRKTQPFEEMSDSDVVSKVGGDAGLSVKVDSTSPTHAYILQRNESDFTFLRRLAARNNYLLRIEDGDMIFKKAQFSGTGFELVIGENVQAFRLSLNSVEQVQEVIVRGWDSVNKSEIVGTASTSDIDKIGDGELGADIAGKFGDATIYITDIPISDQSMADVIAKAEINRVARQFARGGATIKGNPAVRAGKLVTFEGLHDGYNGTFYVLSSRHLISTKSGYVTEFTFCSNCAGS
jgi:phage protein D